ncbi:metal-sulfur cluster assembly factor [Bradyrhizobium japonicum]|uniref:metal-sulfur cluster assembly factor n=1 Tax=Bradyrhizobium japonicum TaxID=375 RepID=UPI0003FE4A53|nr:iron-sulfur cluster assembly protein [Bradyrhizobium japonicum]
MTDQPIARVGDALCVVINPELGEKIVVYDIAVVDRAVRITMSPTTPGRPATSLLKEGAHEEASTVPGVVSVDVAMTFEPLGLPTSSDRRSGPRSASPR